MLKKLARKITGAVKSLLNPVKQLILFFSFIGIVVVGSFITIGVVKAYRFIENPVPLGQIAEVNAKGIETPIEKELGMREWVLSAVEVAGLNSKEADCIIKNESGWNNWNYGVNTNGSTDMGLWQINSIHKDAISVEGRFNYKTATYWAIGKRLNVGHWCDWVVAKTKCGLCN